MTHQSTFAQLVVAEMGSRHWSNQVTAEAAGISHATLTRVLKNGRPSFETCLALGRLFSKPDLYVLRLAGLLAADESLAVASVETT